MSKDEGFDPALFNPFKHMDTLFSLVVEAAPTSLHQLIDLSRLLGAELLSCLDLIYQTRLLSHTRHSGRGGS